MLAVDTVMFEGVCCAGFEARTEEGQGRKIEVKAGGDVGVVSTAEARGGGGKCAEGGEVDLPEGSGSFLGSCEDG